RVIRLHELLLPTPTRLVRSRPEQCPASVLELLSPRLRGTCENAPQQRVKCRLLQRTTGGPVFPAAVPDRRLFPGDGGDRVAMIAVPGPEGRHDVRHPAQARQLVLRRGVRRGGRGP